MMDTTIRVLYNENVTHNVIVNGTESSDGTLKKYLGEKVSIYVGTSDPYKFEVASIDISLKYINTKGVIEFTMPDSDVKINITYYDILDITSDGLVSGTSEFKSKMKDSIDLVIPSTINGIKVTGIASTGFGMSGPKLTSVIIPEGVTKISFGAFEYCQGLTSVTIPNSVTTIDSQAFHDCSALKSITIPDGVTRIETSTFKKCISLTEVSIPASIRAIEFSAFARCTSLISIDIPSNVTSIRATTFENCTNLVTININRSKDSITGSPWGAPNATVNWLR